MECSSNDIIHQDMEDLHGARQNYIAAESSEKIRRVPRHKVNTYSDVVYDNGDKDYYRRKIYEVWKGPAVVLGKKRQTLFVCNGGAFYHVHSCQLMKEKRL